MFKEEYSHGVAKVKTKDFVTKIMATHPTRKSPGESYQDVLNRSDFKKLKKEAKDFAKDYVDERGLPDAKHGMTDTVQGSNWKLVKDFKGQPKHSQGGVDISISDTGVSRRGGKEIKAKFG